MSKYNWIKKVAPFFLESNGKCYFDLQKLIDDSVPYDYFWVLKKTDGNNKVYYYNPDKRLQVRKGDDIWTENQSTYQFQKVDKFSYTGTNWENL